MASQPLALHHTSTTDTSVRISPRLPVASVNRPSPAPPLPKNPTYGIHFKSKSTACRSKGHTEITKSPSETKKHTFMPLSWTSAGYTSSALATRHPFLLSNPSSNRLFEIGIPRLAPGYWGYRPISLPVRSFHGLLSTLISSILVSNGGNLHKFLEASIVSSFIKDKVLAKNFCVLDTSKIPTTLADPEQILDRHYFGPSLPIARRMVDRGQDSMSPVHVDSNVEFCDTRFILLNGVCISISI